MKKIITLGLTLSLVLPSLPVISAENDTETISYNYSYDRTNGYEKSNAHIRQMEKLDRGLVAVKSENGVYLSWRLFDSEDAIYGSADSNVEFVVYRDGEEIAVVKGKTNYTDSTAGQNYTVAPIINGVEWPQCKSVTVMDNNYFDIPLVKPEDETIDMGGTPTVKSFSPTDCSCGDVDGDGEYEIIVKWVSNECDVGNGGYSGTVRFAAYKLDGTKLWDNDINLGKNVYSSAHTVQFLVYDFDGDGKAEMMCQTSLGSKDAKGRYVSHSAKADTVVVETDKKIAEYTDEENAAADFNGYDRKVTGEEFLTVFNGETGAAIDTIDLPTTRGGSNGEQYGDDFGNRSNRFVADVAYLDGVKPYAVYLRGYYFGKNGRQRTSIAGISFDGERLSPDYRFDTQTGQPGYYDGAYNFVGNGNHNCTVADVDNDGKDEFITGALCMEVKDDNTFKPRWCTHKEHGDALHIGDYDPTHLGLEFFTVHEDGDKDNAEGGYGYTNSQGAWCDFGMSVIDADNGDIIFHKGNTKDTGRGVMANTGSGGYYQITGVGDYQCNGGTNFTSTNNGAGSNFRIFWDGDVYDELLDGTATRSAPIGISSFNGSGMTRIFTSSDCKTINDTKNNPALTADLFGDWREEVVMARSDDKALRVYSTTIPTNYKIKTLMHDPVYRSGVAAEQTAYNQPPHVGFYMGKEDFLDTKLIKDDENQTSGNEKTITASKARNEIGKSFNKTKENNVYLNYYSDLWGLAYFGFQNIANFDPNEIIKAEIKFTPTSKASANRPFTFNLLPSGNDWEKGTVSKTDQYPSISNAILSQKFSTADIKVNEELVFDITDYVKGFASGTTEMSIIAAVSPDTVKNVGAADMYILDTPKIVLTVAASATPDPNKTPRPTYNPNVTDKPKVTALPNITATPTVSPSATPTATPTVTPSATPTATPTVSPAPTSCGIYCGI